MLKDRLSLQIRSLSNCASCASSVEGDRAEAAPPGALHGQRRSGFDRIESDVIARDVFTAVPDLLASFADNQRLCSQSSESTDSSRRVRSNKLSAPGIAISGSSSTSIPSSVHQHHRSEVDRALVFLFQSRPWPVTPSRGRRPLSGASTDARRRTTTHESTNPSARTHHREGLSNVS